MSGDLAGDVTPYFKREQLARPEKKPRRLKAGRTRWDEIRAAKEGPCRVCLFVIENWAEAKAMGLDLCGLKPSYHHLVGKDFGGSDTESNIVPLGGDGVKGHHGLVQRLDRAACAALRRMLSDEEYSYIAGKAGEGWLETYYPVAYQAAVSPRTDGQQE